MARPMSRHIDSLSSESVEGFHHAKKTRTLMMREMRARGYGYVNTEELTPDQMEFCSRIRVSRGVKYFDKQVLNYDSRRLNSLGVLDAVFHRGSTFSSVALWRDTLLLLLLASLVGVGVFFWGKHGDYCNDEESSNGPSDAQELAVALLPFTNNLLGLLPFLIGLYLTTALDRWWEMRTRCLGGLWTAMNDLALVSATYFPRPEDKKIRKRLARWCLLSHLLIYKQAMNREDLSDLLADGTLLPNEFERLNGQPSKSQIVWVWIASYFSHLAYGKSRSKLPYREHTLPRVHEICMRARDGIGTLFAYLDSQLPFRYVHLLSFMVWAYNITQAVQSGFVGAEAILTCQWVKLVAEILFVVFVPLLFLALLHLAEHLLNPFRTTSVVDFPRGAIHRFMRDELNALFKGGQNPPYGEPPLWEDDEAEEDVEGMRGVGKHGFRANATARTDDVLSEDDGYEDELSGSYQEKPQFPGRCVDEQVPLKQF